MYTMASRMKILVGEGALGILIEVELALAYNFKFEILCPLAPLLSALLPKARRLVSAMILEMDSF